MSSTMRERLEKLLALEPCKRPRLIYTWVKQGVITLGEFERILLYVPVAENFHRLDNQ